MKCELVRLSKDRQFVEFVMANGFIYDPEVKRVDLTQLRQKTWFTKEVETSLSEILTNP